VAFTTVLSVPIVSTGGPLLVVALGNWLGTSGAVQQSEWRLRVDGVTVIVGASSSQLFASYGFIDLQAKSPQAAGAHVVTLEGRTTAGPGIVSPVAFPAQFGCAMQVQEL
jgi:hypothetical protein